MSFGMKYRLKAISPERLRGASQTSEASMTGHFSLHPLSIDVVNIHMGSERCINLLTLDLRSWSLFVLLVSGLVPSHQWRWNLSDTRHHVYFGCSDSERVMVMNDDSCEDDDDGGGGTDDDDDTGDK